MGAIGDPQNEVFNRLLKNRIVFLGREVDDSIANLITAQLLYLEGEDHDADIWLYVNSPGGSVTAGMAIYDTMQFVRPSVGTICMGLAASMGQFLLCAGAPGKRYALPHSRIMMHQPSGGLRGQAADIAIQAEQMLHIKRSSPSASPTTPARRRRRSRRTPSATAGSPPSRPRTTASSTRSSSGGARSRTESRR